MICPGNSFILNPTLNPAWQIKWQDGTSNPTYTVKQPGTYSLSATNNCGTTQDDIIVSKGICKVYVPSAFTPNNDGLNDLFRVTGTEVISEFELMIFNRWGELIFKTTDKTKGWDGKLKGASLSTGTFVYLLKYKDNTSGKSESLKGTVVLIR
jgi:gliding motility-associated-like protein